ncbi:F-box only protein 24-like [Mixophyes fleayi]|uniref:F-box only protein 24-like n=1 Tax=Mixophyes fleayi TaxID=3061075 RepID=UPI003F4D82BB
MSAEYKLLRITGRGFPVALRLFSPPQLEKIVSYLSVRDVMLLGETCWYLHQLCNGQRIWRNLCEKICPRMKEANDWKRSTILNYTKGMYFHAFARWQRVYGNTFVAPVISNGFQRFLVTKNNVFVLDYAGTLFFLRSALLTCDYSHVCVQFKRSCRFVELCQSVKDIRPKQCDCLEVYIQSTGQNVFKMTFHPTMRFKQIVLLGTETERQLLLLTEGGKVYSMVINEIHLHQSTSYTVQLAMRKVSQSLSHITIAQMYSSQSSVLYITDPTENIENELDRKGMVAKEATIFPSSRMHKCIEGLGKI